MLLKVASEKWANISGENESNLVSFLRRGSVKGRQQSCEVQERDRTTKMETNQTKGGEAHETPCLQKSGCLLFPFEVSKRL